MSYVITDAAPEDLKAIEGIERQCFSLPWTLAQLESQLSDENHVFLAARNEAGEAVGYVGMMNVLDEGYISNVAVAPVYRRRGIGESLLRELERRAGEKALSFLTLEVRAHNESAKSLYEKNGYKPVGLRKNYYENPREDAILMTKILKEA